MNRKFTSLFLALVSLMVLGTGVCLYFTKNGYLMAIHEIMGVLMVAFVLAHAWHNRKALVNYMKSSKSATAKISREFVTAAIIFGLLMAGSMIIGANKKPSQHGQQQQFSFSYSQTEEAYPVQLFSASE